MHFICIEHVLRGSKTKNYICGTPHFVAASIFLVQGTIFSMFDFEVIKKFSISIKSYISAVTGNDLVGPEAIRASLRTREICVQGRRVRASMLHKNQACCTKIKHSANKPRGRALLQRPKRQSNCVAGPNSL